VIIDTSALVAILLGEPGAEQLRAALHAGGPRIPAPVVVELHKVLPPHRNPPRRSATAFIELLVAGGASIVPLSAEAARLAAAAIPRFGTGNGVGGTLNLTDLMVYGTAMALAAPILCTGRDFAATDAAIHPASRLA
jgi:ribonuclease VapC